ncbi:MAG: hypothetical protein ACOYNO_11195 [Saprospiraceae bacterium]
MKKIAFACTSVLILLLSACGKDNAYLVEHNEIEGLGTGGLNVNMPYKEALPGVTKGLFIEFQLRLGLCIGREKAPEIPN